MVKTLIKYSEDFFWPIALRKIKKIGNDFSDTLFNEVIKFDDENKKNLVITVFCSLHNELMTLIIHLIIFRSKKKISYADYFFSKKSRITTALINDKIPKQPFIAELLKNGFDESRVRLFCRDMRSLIFNRRYPKSSPLKFVNLKDDIITIHTGDLLETHMEVEKKKIVYVPTSEWFKKIKSENNFFLSNHEIFFLRNFLESQIFNLFAKYKIHSTKIIDIYIKKLILNFLKNSNSYLGHILENRMAPKHLWTTSGGSLFARILRLSSKLSDGKVIGHDHSHGQGAFKSFINSYIETNFLDEFYVRTYQQKKNLEKELRTSKLRNRFLKIKVVKKEEQKILQIKPTNRKVVMLVSSLYNIDASFLDPLPFATVMLDWEIRTLNYLKSIGYTPIYKPHPESKLNFNSFFETQGFEVNSEKFEKVLSKASIFVFGVPNATCFFFSLRTNLPLVLVDLRSKKWETEALKSLKKRVGYVETHHSRDNRIVLNWNKLKHQLEKSKDLKSNEFARKYFYPSFR